MPCHAPPATLFSPTWRRFDSNSLQLVQNAAVRDVLQHATDVLTSVFAADKVDAFLYDAAQEILVALGTSQTPLGVRQHDLGLYFLSLSDGGRAAWCSVKASPGTMARSNATRSS